MPMSGPWWRHCFFQPTDEFQHCEISRVKSCLNILMSVRSMSCASGHISDLFVWRPGFLCCTSSPRNLDSEILSSSVPRRSEIHISAHDHRAMFIFSWRMAVAADLFGQFGDTILDDTNSLNPFNFRDEDRGKNITKQAWAWDSKWIVWTYDNV